MQSPCRPVRCTLIAVRLCSRCVLSIRAAPRRRPYSRTSSSRHHASSRPPASLHTEPTRIVLLPSTSYPAVTPFSWRLASPRHPVPHPRRRHVAITSHVAAHTVLRDLRSPSPRSRSHPPHSSPQPPPNTPASSAQSFAVSSTGIAGILVATHLAELAGLMTVAVSPLLDRRSPSPFRSHPSR